MNLLYKHHGIEVTQIISLNKNYSLTFVFTSRKQHEKMSVVVDLTTFFEYFDNVVDPAKHNNYIHFASQVQFVISWSNSWSQQQLSMSLLFMQDLYIVNMCTAF